MPGTHGRRENSLSAVCSAVLWVLTHFPCGVAILGISGHIVLMPNELTTGPVWFFGCLSHFPAGANGPAITSSSEVSVECNFLIPNADLFWTLGSLSILALLLPRHKIYSGPSPYLTKAIRHWVTDTGPSA